MTKRVTRPRITLNGSSVRPVELQMDNGNVVTNPYFLMRTAPRDGRRILVKTYLFGYSEHHGRSIKTGTAWVECWYDPTHRGGSNPQWREWCGNYATTSTGTIDPIAWLPHPEGENVRKDPT